MLIALALALAVQIPSTAAEQDVAKSAQPRELGPLLEPLQTKHGVPALAGAIVIGPHLFAIGAVGKRRVDADTRVTADDLWHLGSCTKSMTATWIAKLVEAEEITWETTLAEVYPGLAASGAMHADWHEVPLALLVQNRSGAPKQLNAGGLWGQLWRHEGTPAEQRRALVEGVLARAPEVEPDTRYVYSNAGFSIAAAMAETVLGAAYEERITQDLFDPLGMRAVGFGAPGAPGEVAQPFGHRTAKNGLVPVELGRGDDNPSAIAPAGKVHASLQAWARYAGAHLAGARGESEFLSTETFERLHRPGLGDYAMGWIVRELPWAPGRVIWHNGSNSMWYCEIALVPEANCALLVACNSGTRQARKAVGETLIRLYEHYEASKD